MQSITYRALQLLVKQLQAQGLTTVKANSKAIVLLAELVKNEVAFTAIFEEE